MGDYWFCVKHHAVEPADGCGPIDRLGPYPTEAEAARALQKVAERNEQWETDPDWNEDVPPGPPADGPSGGPSSGPSGGPSDG